MFLMIPWITRPVRYKNYSRFVRKRRETCPISQRWKNPPKVAIMGGLGKYYSAVELVTPYRSRSPSASELQYPFAPDPDHLVEAQAQGIIVLHNFHHRHSVSVWGIAFPERRIFDEPQTKLGLGNLGSSVPIFRENNAYRDEPGVPGYPVFPLYQKNFYLSASGVFHHSSSPKATPVSKLSWPKRLCQAPGSTFEKRKNYPLRRLWLGTSASPKIL